MLYVRTVYMEPVFTDVRMPLAANKGHQSTMPRTTRYICENIANLQVSTVWLPYLQKYIYIYCKYTLSKVRTNAQSKRAKIRNKIGPLMCLLAQEKGPFSILNVCYIFYWPRRRVHSPSGGVSGDVTYFMGPGVRIHPPSWGRM